MSSIKQSFVADITAKSANDLIAAYDNIPQDKKAWTPLEMGRSANDQMAECAMLAGKTADTLKSNSFGHVDFQAYYKEKEELASNPDQLTQLLAKNAAMVVEAIRATTDDNLTFKIDAPWGPMAIEEIIIYPYWNMTYHLGQINYIASLLGCLK